MENNAIDNNEISFGSRYQILDKRVGNSSIVYKAEDKELNLDVAIKVPSKAVEANPLKLERFIEEGKKLARVQSSYVLSVMHLYKPGEICDSWCMVTNWMEQTLEQVIQREDLNYQTISSIITKVLKGISALHIEGIIHRNIKPACIYLSHDANQVRLGGLDIAAASGSDETLLQPSSKYIAPECYTSEYALDRRSDLYSVGFLAYEMLLGQEKFKEIFQDIYSAETERLTETRWLNWHINSSQVAPAIETIRPDIPKKICDIVAKMMHNSLQERYADAEEILVSLQEFTPGFQADKLSSKVSTAESIIKPLPIDNNESKTAAFQPLSIDTGPLAFLKEKLNLTDKQIKIIAISLLSVLVVIILVYALIIHPANLKRIKAEQDQAAAQIVIMEELHQKAILINNINTIKTFSSAETFYTSANTANKNEQYIRAFNEAGHAVKDYRLTLLQASKIERDKIEEKALQSKAIAIKVNSNEMVEFREAEKKLAEANNLRKEQQIRKAINSYKDAYQLFVSAYTKKRISFKVKAEQEKTQAKAKNADKLSEFIEADRKLDEANGLKTEQFIEQAIKTYQDAYQLFLIAKEKAPILQLKEEVYTFFEKISDFKDAWNMDVFIQAKSSLSAADNKFENMNFSEAKDLYITAERFLLKTQLALKKLAARLSERRIVNKEQTSFYVGSNSDELKEAVQLCKDKFNASCGIEDFNDEDHSEVTIMPFAMNRYEVSNKQFLDFTEQTNYLTTAEKKGFAYKFTGFSQVKTAGVSWRTPEGINSTFNPDLPVTFISQLDAKAYCKWRDGRLPSYEEWEYAARGDKRRIFPWGNKWNKTLLIWKAEKAEKPGTISASVTPEGIYNLAGNVSEWTRSIKGDGAILKGGSFIDDNPAEFRAASWRISEPSEAYSDYGIRCVYDLK